MAEYEFPEELLYTKDDEWVRRDGEEFVIGVSDFAQRELGDIVFVELPEVGTTSESGQAFGTIESVKAVSDLCAPLSGEITAINEALEETPETVNESCYGDGWLIRIRPSDESEIEGLLDVQTYRSFVAERSD